jgi:hypothetical protein
MLAYDDLYSIEYFGARLQPYWRRNGASAADMLLAAAQDYTALTAQCAAFDSQLMGDLGRVGGDRYARLCAAAGRTNEAQQYLTIATNYAVQWQSLAADTGHTRLAYNLPGTWSMKHNLIWDRVLGLESSTAPRRKP